MNDKGKRRNIKEDHCITVSVRIRPPRSPSALLSINTNAALGKVAVGTKAYRVSRVIQGSDQLKAYNAIAKPLLDNLRRGLSCTLCAYGQTGSGKTHTVFGPPGSLTVASVSQAAGEVPPEWGIFPRMVLDILNTDSGSTLHASAVEIYQECAYDLLADRSPLTVGSKKAGLKVGSGVVTVHGNDRVSNHCGTHPPGCSCRKCFKALSEMKAAKRRSIVDEGRSNSSPKGHSASNGQKQPNQFATIGETLQKLESAEDVARFALLIEGTRTAVGHALNDRSSRSHCLINLNISQRTKDGKLRQRKLLVVDLAGSERIAKSGVVGVARHQATSINGSLTVLGKVVRALSVSQKHIPYRDSTLTMLLRRSLDDPMAATSFIINVAPDAAYAEETVCSLEFGKRLGSVPHSTGFGGNASATDDGVVDIDKQLKCLQIELKAAKTRLAQAEARGQGESFDPSAPEGEVQLFRNNLRRVHQEEEKTRTARAELAELRALSKAGSVNADGNNRNNSNRIAAAEAKLQAREKELTNYRMILERQKSIRGFYRPAKEICLACEKEVRHLQAQIDMLQA